MRISDWSSDVCSSDLTDSSDTTAIPGMAFMAILLVAGAWRDAMRRLRLYAARWTRPVPLMRFRRTVDGHPANRVWAPAPPAPWSHRCPAGGGGREIGGGWGGERVCKWR